MKLNQHTQTQTEGDKAEESPAHPQFGLSHRNKGPEAILTSVFVASLLLSLSYLLQLTYTRHYKLSLPSATSFKACFITAAKCYQYFRVQQLV